MAFGYSVAIGFVVAVNDLACQVALSPCWCAEEKGIGLGTPSGLHPFLLWRACSLGLRLGLPRFRYRASSFHNCLGAYLFVVFYGCRFALRKAMLSSMRAATFLLSHRPRIQRIRYCHEFQGCSLSLTCCFLKK